MKRLGSRHWDTNFVGMKSGKSIDCVALRFARHESHMEPVFLFFVLVVAAHNLMVVNTLYHLCNV